MGLRSVSWRLVILLNDFEHFVLVVKVHRFDFPVRSRLFVIPIKTSVFRGISIVFVVSYMRGYSRRAPRNRSFPLAFVDCSAAYRATIAQPIHIWYDSDFCNRGWVLHLHGALFPWLVIRVKWSILDACKLVVVGPWGVLFVLRISSRAGNSHLVLLGVGGMILLFVVWIHSLLASPSFLLDFEGLGALVGIDTVLIRVSLRVFHVLFFVTVILIWVQIVLQPRLICAFDGDVLFYLSSLDSG